MLTKGKLRKPCTRCGEMFVPIGKFNRLCLDCWNKSIKKRYIKDEDRFHVYFNGVFLGITDNFKIIRKTRTKRTLKNPCIRMTGELIQDEDHIREEGKVKGGMNENEK